MVVRGRLVPKLKNGELLVAEIINNDTVKRAFQALLDHLSNSLENFSRFKSSVTDYPSLNSFLNYYIFSLRAAIYVDPDREQAWLRSVPKFLHLAYIIQELRDVKSYYEKLYEVKLSEPAYKSDLDLLLEIPADSRPGTNSASYLVYSQTVAAIAVSIYISRNQNKEDYEKELAFLRLLCIFYPFISLLGKQKVLEMLGQFDLPVFKEFLSFLQDFEQSELFKIYNDAVTIAFDTRNLEARVKAIQQELIEKSVTDANNPALDFESEKTQYKDDEKIKQITEILVRKVLKNKNENLQLDQPIIIEDVKVVRFDIRSIQNEIRVNDLRTMSFSSFLVDFAVFIKIPIELSKFLPAECILYYGGGNVTVVMPKEIKGKCFENKLDDVRQEVAETLRLGLNYGFANLSSDFEALNREIDINLATKKFQTPSGKGISSLLNMSDYCSICNRRPASELEPEREELRLCEKCRVRRRTANEYHFSRRLDILGKDHKILEYVMEYIAGSSIDTTEKTKKNIAIVKFDANNIGRFMGSCINLADAFEKSILIDRSIKEAFSSFLSRLRKINPDEAGRLFLGTIYIGGDDGFVLMPSRISIYFAVYMVNKFFELMGGTISLSCGIAVAKPNHPYISLFEAAQFLLDDIAKKGTRRENYALLDREPTVKGYRGTIAFYVANGGFADENIVEEYLRTTFNSRISWQYYRPYILTDENVRNNVINILNIINNALGVNEFPYPNSDPLEDSIFEVIPLLIDNEESKKNIRSNIIQPIKSTFSVRVSGDGSLQIKVLYARRQIRRLENDRKGPIYSAIVNLLDFETGLPLVDINLVAKIAIGE